MDAILQDQLDRFNRVTFKGNGYYKYRSSFDGKEKVVFIRRVFWNEEREETDIEFRDRIKKYYEEGVL